jgi:hypothetical protein
VLLSAFGLVAAWVLLNLVRTPAGARCPQGAHLPLPGAA